jgi:hypothetical protein
MTKPGVPAAKEQGPKVPAIAAVGSGLEPDHPHKEAQAEAGGNWPLSWVNAGIERLRLAFEALPQFFGTNEKLVAAVAMEKPDNVGLEDQAPRVTEKTNNPAATVPDPVPANGTETGAAPESAQAAGQKPGAAGQGENEIAGQAMESHAQAIQAVGGKMRAAFEQNTQVTVSLFNRTLELIDQQNQKLSEVNRRIAELSGQVKSLKNL